MLGRGAQGEREGCAPIRAKLDQRRGLTAPSVLCREAAMDRGGPAGSPLISSSEPAPPVVAVRDLSPGRTGPGPSGPGGGARSGGGRPAAANAARERSRVQTLRHAFLELQRTLPSVPPDTKLSKLDVLLLATTYIAHLTRSLQDDAEAPADPGLGALRGDGYLHPVKVGGQGTEEPGPGARHHDLPSLTLLGQILASSHRSFRVRQGTDPESDLRLPSHRQGGPHCTRLLLNGLQVVA